MLHGLTQQFLACRSVVIVPLLLAMGLPGCAKPALAPPSSPSENCFHNMKFEDATLYAGSTDYHFALADGVSVIVRIENGKAAATGFESLLGPAEDGPAEASPDRIGKPFTICRLGSKITATPAGKAAAAE